MFESQLDFEISFFEKLVKEKPDFVNALIPLAEAYTRKGCYEKGLQIDQRLVRLRKEDPTVHYNLACSYALLNQAQQALRTLKKAIQLGYRDFSHMAQDGDLKNLHGESRFQELLKQKKKS